MAAWYSTVFILSALALFGLAYFLLSTSLAQKDHEIIESELKRYAALYEGGGVEAVAADVNAGHQESFFVRVLDRENQTLYLNIPTQWDDFDAAHLSTRLARGERKWTFVRGKEEGEFFEDPDILEILSTDFPNGASLQVGRTTESRKDTLEYFQGIFAVVMIAVLGIGFAGGGLLARRSLRPVRDLAGTIRSVRETGRLDARVPTRQAGDELDELAELFNALLGTVESLITRMRSALDNIAHELRTPMTRLRGSAEMALRSNPDIENYKEALGDCLEESEQVLTMLNTLTDISEAEAGAMKLDLEEVNLPGLIRSVLGVYQEVADDKGVALEAALPDQLALQADAKRIRQVVANLVDNAIKYTPQGGRIGIEARIDRSQAVLTVKDTGAGIKPDELPKIWDRLYRGEAGHAQRGLGLGLSLVRAVVAAHGGSVEAQSEPGQGSRFLIRLPVRSAGKTPSK